MRAVLRGWVAAIGCVLLLSAVGSATARADATIEVETTSDVGSGTCSPSSGTCTLREALELAQQGQVAGEVRIRVNASGDIEISPRGPLAIDPAAAVETLEIRGPGPEQLAIDGGEDSEIFEVEGGFDLIAGMTLKHGAAFEFGGGAIHQSGGRLSVIGVKFEENSTVGGLPGGAILQEGGELSVGESSFVENYAERSPTHSGDGGAIFAASPGGELHIDDSEFLANQADDNGGAIYLAAGEAQIRGGKFAANVAGFDGGAIVTESPGSLATGLGVSFVENRARHGGGLMVRPGAGSILVAESWFSGNEASVQGGGMYAAAATTVERSTFSGNTSPSNTEHSGGGIATAEVPLTLSESTLTANVGGAIDLGLDAPVTIRGSTIVGNTDAHNVGAGVAGEATVTSSVLYGNQGSEGEGNCEGTMISGGHNIVGAPGRYCAWETASGDLFDADPLLGALTENGGPTPTLAPASRLSPAINHGSEPGPTDQRGLARPVPAGAVNTDVGAVEVQAPEIEAGPAISPDSGLVTGEQLTCLPGSWNEDTVSDASHTYEWLLQGDEVGSAPTYTLRSEDAGKELVCRETVDNGATAETAESEPVELEPGRAGFREPPPALDLRPSDLGSGPGAPLPPSACVVPNLRGRTLKDARKALRRRGCRLGAVGGERGKGARVLRQHPQPARSLPFRSPVRVELRSRSGWR